MVGNGGDELLFDSRFGADVFYTLELFLNGWQKGEVGSYVAGSSATC